MNAIVEFLWLELTGSPQNASAWAEQILMLGHGSDTAVELMGRLEISQEDRQRLVAAVLHEINLGELTDVSNLMREYERGSIGDYLAGNLSGWDLIHRGCELFWSDENVDPGRAFWVRLADDADQHGGQGHCIEYDFRSGDFDTVLRNAIRSSGRPLPDGIDWLNEIK